MRHFNGYHLLSIIVICLTINSIAVAILNH